MADPDASADSTKGAPQIEVTPEMIQAVAKVILSQCGDEWATMTWAERVAEDCLAEYGARLKQALAAEREACAVAVGEWFAGTNITASQDFNDGVRWACTHIPTYIRIRGDGPR